MVLPLKDIDFEKPVKSYLFTSVHNRCLNFIRDNKKFSSEGLRYHEIADKLGISVKTVEAQMSKSLKILREKLEKYTKLMILWWLLMN